MSTLKRVKSGMINTLLFPLVFMFVSVDILFSPVNRFFKFSMKYKTRTTYKEIPQTITGFLSAATIHKKDLKSSFTLLLTDKHKEIS